MFVSKEKIKGFAPVIVPFPQLDGDLFIRRMSIAQKNEWIESVRKEGVDFKEVGFGVLSRFLLNESGEPMFSREELPELDDVLVDDILREILRVNRLLPDAVKEAEKN